MFSLMFYVVVSHAVRPYVKTQLKPKICQHVPGEQRVPVVGKCISAFLKGAHYFRATTKAGHRLKAQALRCEC